MIKNEFKTLEKHAKELEALKGYPRVKQERDSLAMEVAQLKEKVAALESELSTKKGLSSQISKQEAEIKELAGKLAHTGKELTSLRDFKVKLPDGTEHSLPDFPVVPVKVGLLLEEEVIVILVRNRVLLPGRATKGTLPVVRGGATTTIPP